MPDFEHPLAHVLEFLRQQEALGLTRLPKGDPASVAAIRSAVVNETGAASDVVDVALPAVEQHPEADAIPAGEKPADSDVDPSSKLKAFHTSISECTDCGLAEGRRMVVFGSGNAEADIMFVGEAPGAEEDREGVPFVGAAGQLLTKMIEAIGLTRDDVFIANVIKCRRPGNRDPQPEEIAACRPFLERQIEIVKPKFICTLGRFTAQLLLNSTESMGKLRGKVYAYEPSAESAGRPIKLIPTYHPSALLRNAKWKRPAWEDLKLLLKEYERQ